MKYSSLLRYNKVKKKLREQIPIYLKKKSPEHSSEADYWGHSGHCKKGTGIWYIIFSGQRQRFSIVLIIKDKCKIAKQISDFRCQLVTDVTRLPLYKLSDTSWKRHKNMQNNCLIIPRCFKKLSVYIYFLSNYSSIIILLESSI